MRVITIIDKERVGLLADVSYILAKNKINIETIDAVAMGDTGVIVMTVSDPKKAIKVLKENGYNNVDDQYSVLRLENKPGELNKIAQILAKNKINIQHTHVIAKDGNTALIAIKVDKPKKARNLLREYLIDSEN